MSTSRIRARLLTSLLTLACVAPPLCAGDEPLFQPNHFPGPPSCRAVATGDLDGDGDLDLVAAGNGEARVLLNLGGRAFETDKSWPGGATDAALADLDGDGDLDLVVTDFASNQVFVRLGGGSATFGPSTAYVTTAAPGRLQVADLDADGDADLVIGLNSIRVAILLGNGDGTFSAAPDVGPAGASDKAVAVADLDGDGVLDLAVSAQSSQIVLFRGQGDGTFVAAGTIGGLFVPVDVVAGDMDGDGDQDVLAADQSFPIKHLSIFANDGSGAFPGAPFIAALPGLPSRLALADLDEDGHLDVLVSMQSTGHGVASFLGQGDGTALALTGVAAISPSGLAVADLDGDGDLDLVSAESFVGAVDIGWGEGDGTFRRGVATEESSQEVAAVDLDGDGDLDLVAANDSGVTTALNTGNGHVATARNFPSADFEIGIAAGDFDGDGKADVVSSNWSVSLASGGKFWKGDGAGGLAAPLALSLPARMNDVHAADLDLDGDLDLVFATAEGAPSPGAGSLYAILGHGDGSFDTALAASLGGKVSAAIAIGDFNGDGAPDVLAAGLEQSVLMVLLGHGDGTFDAPIATPPSDSVHDVVTGDFNGDGLLDAAFTRTSNFAGPALGVRFGAGDGTLLPVVSYGIPSSYDHLDAGDINHDGQLDLVVGHPGHVLVFVNQGAGTFALQEDVTAALADTHVALADMDGDGWTDVVQAKGGDFAAELSILINQAGPWNDLGQPLAGTAGLPRQTGEGTLIGNEQFRFTLRDARPNTTAYHIVGLNPLFAPLKGGVLVPTIDFINSLPVTDAQGEVVLQGHWLTNLPPGFDLYFQFWLADPAGPHGFAASNAIKATTP